MNYLLDTNIISELISKNPNKKVIDFILSLNEEKLYLSVITIGEIKSGIEKLDDGRKKEKLLHWLENDLLVRFHNRIIDIDIEVMLQWGVTNTQLKKLGKPLPIMDSIIGSIAQAKNLILLTRNENDFKNLDIKIINPFN
ncbi:type II toxin-antitoxin system VapC family toxin [Hydrogenimonas thermophila]|uniref:PIN domain-containing protein n=1 Tax=Hydrogenimonas thermophila TaxID=223786 RepID=A0A1I5N5B4_9BACT|nr:type II toxin-antitoxin system VapC family toxin [Hydrogenimonas thermophila]WOE70258.1 type II toxin-antitoxin system VapC family toxin [Hydrogenimonas thermophila]WOE72775.1 type II toxin-antitoxin system VapC family toxin [Hydrogenimonas thermophila]SFP17029.1 hypothetical protein/tRNA(fMet)-specific endonuclease VapC [Hydrogenimonas thermophila]